MGDLIDLSGAGVLSIIMMCFKWHHPPLPHLMTLTLGHVKWTQSNAGARWGDGIYSQVSVGSVFFDLIVNKGTVFLMCLDKCFLSYSHGLRVSLYSERRCPTVGSHLPTQHHNNWVRAAHHFQHNVWSPSHLRLTCWVLRTLNFPTSAWYFLIKMVLDQLGCNVLCTCDCLDVMLTQSTLKP